MRTLIKKIEPALYMTTQAENPESKSAGLVKWVAVVALLILASLGNHYLTQFPVILRWVAAGLLAVGAFALAFTTSQGRAFILVLKDAQVEARKVVWPTGEETWRTTLIVLAVVVISSLLLWGLDSLFGLIISSIIG